MGLDGVELVIEVEQAFEVDISDEEAGAIRTVGELYRSILSKIELRPSGRCPSQVAFHRLRRALKESFGTSRAAVRPDAPLEAIVPAGWGRKAAWDRLGESLGFPIPGLVRSGWLVITLMLIVVVSTSIIGMELIRSAPIGPAVIAILFVLVILSLVVGRVTAPLAVHIPREAATVRDALRGSFGFNDLKSLNAAPDVRVDGPMIFEMLRRIIVEQLGVRPERVTEEAEFVKDLGLS